MSGMRPPAPKNWAHLPTLIGGLILAILAISPAHSQEVAAPETLTNSAAIVTIAGTIDGGTYEDFRNTVEALKEKELRFLIIKLDTPGGTIEASRQLAEYIALTSLM